MPVADAPMFHFNELRPRIVAEVTRRVTETRHAAAARQALVRRADDGVHFEPREVTIQQRDGFALGALGQLGQRPGMHRLGTRLSL